MTRTLIAQSDSISFRGTTEADLDFVISNELQDSNAGFIHHYSDEKHRECLTNPDCGHWIIERVEDRRPIGYLILFGLVSPHKSCEFRRIVITEKGAGYGRAALKLIKHVVFDKWKFHRLWLDVMEHNERARYLYKTEGFVEEGLLREAILKDGNHISLVLMSMLSQEYHALA